MMNDIKRLLKKKGWTGKELGRIEIANMAYMFRQQLQGKTPTPLVTKGALGEMIKTLKDPIQIKAYNEYIKIHEWLSVTYNITSAQEQQAQSNFKTLINYISVAYALEQTYAYMDMLPVIMTEKQYQDCVNTRTKEILNQSDKSLNLFNLFNEALECLIDRLDSNPRKANPLKALKPQLKAKTVKDPRILNRYNEVMARGYYTINKTGQRSDRMKPSEWQKAIEDLYPGLAKRLNAYFEQVDSLIENLPIEKKLRLIESKHGQIKEISFCLYAEPPQNLNCWEILRTGDLNQYYRSLENKDPNGNQLTNQNYIHATTEDIKAFKKEFPEVFEAVSKDMKKYMGEVVDNTIEKWADTIFSWEDLRQRNFYDFDDTYLNDTAIFDGNKRAVLNGVAILKPSTFNGNLIDDKGYYKDPDLLKKLFPFSLEALFPDSPNYADNAEEIETARQLLIGSYYFMLGFNKALNLIEQYYELPQLKVFSFDTELMAERMEDFNSLATRIYNEIKARDYKNKEVKNKKIEALKNFFSPLEYENLEIPQKNIDQLTKMFHDGQAFEDSNITSLLCFRYIDGVEHE